MKSFFEIYESIILEAMSLEEIWEKYYRKDVNILEMFKTLNYMDPTSSTDKKGKYLDWIIKHAYKNNPSIEEDYDKVQEDLDLFDKNYRHINKQITQIKDQYELAQLVKEFRDKKLKGEIDPSRSEIKAGAEKLYEDNEWLIIHPKTLESAQFYGRHTRWCTASENNNMFNHYNSQGPLYIIINKENPAIKYQFHFQSEQYMDAEDISIYDEDINHTFNQKTLDKLVELSNINKSLFTFLNFFDIADKYKEKYKKEFDNNKLNEEMLTVAYDGKLDDMIDKINKGADIHYKNDQIVANIKHIEILNYIIDNTDINIKKHYKNLMNTAARMGNIAIIKKLIEKGAEVKGYDMLLEAVANQHLDLVKYLVEEHLINVNASSQILGIAVRAPDENLAIIKYLLDKGIDVTKNDSSALKVASDYVFNPKIIKMLIEHGANPDKDSNIGLYWSAVSHKNLDLLKLYVERKFFGNKLDISHALKLAADNGLFDIFTYLYEHALDRYEKERFIDNAVNMKWGKISPSITKYIEEQLEKFENSWRETLKKK